MFKTKVTEMLGCKYPIIGGTMARISNAEFVAAICNAGAVGILASANYYSPEEFSEAIDQLKSLTDQPFAVNINLFPAMRKVDNNEFMDVLTERGVRIVETSGHAAPTDLSRRFKEAGMIWMHKCVGLRYALKAQTLGADLVTVVGYENGGATGQLDLGTLVLVPRVVEALNIPVIGGGGVADGRGLLAVLSLGAVGVIMGTRLLMTREAPIHDNLKKALIEASELDTRLVMRSIGATHRVWANSVAEKLLELEGEGADFKELIDLAAGEKANIMFTQGDLDAGIIACGQNVGLAHDIPTLKELFARMMEEATQGVKSITA
ncbi:MAG: nitronate monooxygenase [Deltaproteobacteria bacterium]|nr:nitronate monooxygenase [Deltaproteobacteria bacterium]